jgi:hypothetical protein
MTDETERLARIRKLASLILGAAGHLEKENWLACQRLCEAAAKQSRILILSDQQEAAEKGYV